MNANALIRLAAASAFALFASFAQGAPMNAAAAPANCQPAPKDSPVLYLRGSMSNWGTQEEYAFTYNCDAWYLNVDLKGRQEFKIADEFWTPAHSYGGRNGGATVPREQDYALARGDQVGGTGNLEYSFSGEHTLRVSLDGARPTLFIGPKTFADLARRKVEDPVALSLRHDSRDLHDRSPFGAVTAGSKIDFALSALPGVESATLVVERRRLEGNQDVLEYSELARVPMQRQAAGPDGRERWTASQVFDGIGIYGYSFDVRIGGHAFLYQNNKDAVYWTRERGSNGLGSVSEAKPDRRNIRRYRLTVYSADFVVPDWAADAVFYYIFPERFRNGDANNDPRPGVDRFKDGSVEFHKNWNDRPWRPGSGDGSDDLYSNDFFGGDIEGIIQKLDYIHDLGANTLYITPMFTASSNHKYDTADYRNIDPHFGSNADFTRLTVEAAKRGIRVIPDASLNHTGSDSIYFDRFNKYGGKGAFAGGKINRESPYADWYQIDPSKPTPDQQYRGWVGVADLPELNKASPSYRRFAYGDPDSVMKIWLDRGAAGWRMDVAPWVPDDFWREWRKAIKQHKPDALTISETWFDSAKFFLGDEFDSTMNYIFRNAVLDYANGGKAGDSYASLEYIREAYPPQSAHALMNLVSSHDVARALHVFGWEHAEDTPEKIALAKQRLRLAFLFQAAYPGAPAIYYGDEVGVAGGPDPYNRATYPWPDLGGKPDMSLHAEMQRLLALRREHAVLRRGSLSAPLLLDDHVVVFAREGQGELVLVALNNAESEQLAGFTLPTGTKATRFEDLLSGEVFNAQDGRLNFTVPAIYGRMLIAR